MHMKSMHRASVIAVAAAFAFATGAAFAESFAVKEDAAQLKSDKAALQRELARLGADEARLKLDTASGRMSAESVDAYAVYKAQEAIKGEKKDIAADKAGSLQMKADKAAMRRQVKQLETAEARLKSDTMSGRMAAESNDSETVYKDRQAIKAEEKQIVADKAKLHADQQE
jgi:hypothetical protein